MGDDAIADTGRADLQERVSRAIVKFVARVPATAESAIGHEQPITPAARARELTHSAAMKTALAAGGLALPPGPLGWLTILPELTAVWKIQAQLVSDIAGLYGASATLDREHMLYCLFRHTAAQAFRDLAVRAGERILVRRLSTGALQSIARSVGIGITQRAIGKGVTRFVPLLGAAGVGAYAYFDTRQVAKTAVELFAQAAEHESQPASAPRRGPRR
ncbi:MAG: hypothetical protein KJZ83_03640 [Burkholderiaceae bacterium]|nr:hypothetical protein [Burkholderiaceae bacterium]